MFKQLDLTQLGGLYTYQTTLDFLQTAYAQAIDAIAASYGDKVIIAGLAPVAGGNIADGWVVLNAELLPVVGGPLQPYVWIETITDPEAFADGSSKPVYVTRRLRFTSVSAGNIPWADFSRLPYCVTSLADGFAAVKAIIAKLAHGENVIFTGGVATLAGSNVNITAGTALIDGLLVSFAAYSGAFPVYLDSAGAWVTSAPASGITYDHDTAQHYGDVNKRKSARPGELVMHAAAAELQYFDLATGLGKWRWAGWKISDSMRDRVPVGYDRRSSSTDAEYDSQYNTLLSPTGAKTKTLLSSNMPDRYGISATGSTSDFENSGGGGSGFIQFDRGTYGQAFDIRQPGRTILFIERMP